MSEKEWTAADRCRIAAEGLTVAEVERQLALFCRGISPVRLNRPCRTEDGIVNLAEDEMPSLLDAYEEAVRTRRIMKFVPASGAASRMFREWYRFLDKGGFDGGPESDAFLRDLKRYAFLADLEAAVAGKGGNLKELMSKKETSLILRMILTEDGLNYGCLPKGLLKFHAYPEGDRTALEEHLVEAALYARDSGNVASLHFTVSGEHESAFRERLSQVLCRYEENFETRYVVGFSTQEPATNTIAADLENRPFRDDRGGLVFRPGGHGALLENLNALEADIVFLKNIDNVVPDRLKTTTVLWKKLLAGYMIHLQTKVFRSLHILDGNDCGQQDIAAVEGFCEREMNIVLPAGFRERPIAERRSFLTGKLNRPLRVCGMVKNEGEPGGGPFWVDSRDRTGVSLQIIEESQVDGADPGQRALWLSATHFNPVDLVCGIRDYRGQKFDLTDFVDQEMSSISRKSEKGRDLRALERPGLWNGSMAFWNTIFVQVPLLTFNPVKTVTDLIRREHLLE